MHSQKNRPGSTTRTFGRTALALAAAVACAGLARAQTAPLEQQVIVAPYDSGSHANVGTEPEVVLSFPVYMTGAPWMRLQFSEVELSGDVGAGTGSILRITALLDGAQQRQNAIHVAQWENTSAYFNGDAVLVEVLAYPNTGANRVVLDSVIIGEPTFEESQCGSLDDRVPSSDPRSGRLLSVGCTGWIINDGCGCMLTAGHCGPSGSYVLQFNVPASNSNGSLNNPGPEDQYSVDTASIQTNGGQGVGNDYAYFGCDPNSNTGLTALEAQGSAFNIVNPPSYQNGQQIRITGFGVDFNDNTRNQTQQTHVGPRVNASSSTEVEYQTDTEGGNSGSPVIFESTGDAIGIHTHGGCSGSSGNHGTGINHPGLQGYLAAPKGVCSLIPAANFTASPTSGTAPLTVNFTDLSSGQVDTYVWSFGDGGSSTLEDPVHVYVTPGTYGVSLTVSNANGSDTETKTDLIQVDGPVDATCSTYNGTGVNPNVYTCVTDPILGTTWVSQVDNTTIGATGLFFVFAYLDELNPGLPLGVGELLVDLGSPFGALSFGLVSPTTSTVGVSVPNDASLSNTMIHAQAFFNNVGGMGLLTNGIELTFGSF